MFEFWKFISEHMKFGQSSELLIVFESKGSSPGRKGFKMAVSGTENWEMRGSIGGGIMEHKLVELSRARIKNDMTDILIKRQVHRKDEAKDQSGMICSGEQTIAFVPMRADDKERLKTVLSIMEALQGNDPGTLKITNNSFEFIPKQIPENDKEGIYNSDDDWEYTECVGFSDSVYIVGGGHVSQALCDILSNLEFHVTVFDEREDLKTMVENDDAHVKVVVPYEEVAAQIPEGPNTYVILVTFGYRTDKIVLEGMLDKEYAYLGMMGSEKKIDEMYADLRMDGVPKEKLDRVSAPIGMPINSKTPTEIAVSIVAELIELKNK